MVNQILVPSALIGFDGDVNRQWTKVAKRAAHADNVDEFLAEIPMEDIADSEYQIIFDGTLHKLQANEAVLMYSCLTKMLDAFDHKSEGDRHKWVNMSRKLLMPLLNQLWFALAVMSSQRIFPPRIGTVAEPEMSREFLRGILKSWDTLSDNADRYMDSDGVPLTTNRWTAGTWPHLKILGVPAEKIREFKEMTAEEIADVIKAIVAQ